MIFFYVYVFFCLMHGFDVIFFLFFYFFYGGEDGSIPEGGEAESKYSD